MKKNKLALVLAAAMMISSVGFTGGSRVKADETDAAQIEVASPSEPEASEGENADEKANVIDNVNENDLIVTADQEAEDSAPDAEDMADSKWIKDYDYMCFNDGDVVLFEYLGTAQEVTVYKHATIKGRTYNTVLGNNENGSIWWSQYEAASKRKVKKINFEDGFVFPEDCSRLFANCIVLESIYMNGVDTSKTTNMEGMFKGCWALKELDLSSFNTKKVTNMNGMFYGCHSLTKLDLSSFDTSNVECVGSMFHSCRSLKSLNLSKFDLKNVKENSDRYSDYQLYKMLYDCAALETLYSPLNLTDEVKLENRMYDAKGKVHDTLPTGSATTKKLVLHSTGWGKGSDEWYYLKDNMTYITQTPIFGYGYINGVKDWYIAYKGHWDKTFTGLAQYDGKDGWGFARNGKRDLSFSGIALATNGKWYYVNKGKLDLKFTGKIAQTTDGKWYYCTDGRPDLKFSGKIAYCTNGNWYYVTKGRIDRSFTGIAEATNGNKYYVVKGVLNKNYTGKVTYNGKTYNIVKGAVK